MKHGTICWVNLEPVSPPEMGKTRPAVVVSNSDQNLILQTVVVVPLSSQPGEVWPLRLQMQSPHHKVSFAVLPGIRQVNKKRLQEVIGVVHPEDLERMSDALSCYLND